MQMDNYSLKVIENDELTVRLEVEFSSDLKFFDGHFDDFKILPALYQTHFALEQARRYLDIKCEPQVIPNMKFMRPILPMMKVELMLNWDASKEQLNFKYSQGDKIFSQGAMREC